MMLVAAFQKHPGQHPESPLDIERRAPVVLVLLEFALETPNTDCAVETEPVQRNPDAEIRALQCLFFVSLPACAPTFDWMVVVCGDVDNSALHIHARPDALMRVLEIIIVEERASRDGVRVEMRAKHQAGAGINSLAAFNPVPQDDPVLHKESGAGSVVIFPVPNRNDDVRLPAHALVPHPGDARVQTEALVQKQDPAMPNGILDGFDEHARAFVSKGLSRTFGVIAPFRLIEGGGGRIVRGVAVARGEARACGIMAAEHAAPQLLQHPG